MPPKRALVNGQDQQFKDMCFCPKCEVAYTGFIYMCPEGHPICTACKAKEGKCPTCGNVDLNRRDKTREDITRIVRMPCLYEKCPHNSAANKLPVAELATHMSTCVYKPYFCKVFELCNPECEYHADTPEALVQHVRTKHKGEVVFAPPGHGIGLAAPLVTFPMDVKLTKDFEGDQHKHTFWWTALRAQGGGGGEEGYFLVHIIRNGDAWGKGAFEFSVLEFTPLGGAGGAGKKAVMHLYGSKENTGKIEQVLETLDYRFPPAAWAEIDASLVLLAVVRIDDLTALKLNGYTGTSKIDEIPEGFAFKFRIVFQ